MNAFTFVVLAAAVLAYASAQTASGTMNTGSSNCAPGSCPSSETACDINRPDHKCGCCPYRKGDCCPDHAHCCPHGYLCDIPDGQCIQQKGAFGNNFFMPKALPFGKIH